MEAHKLVFLHQSNELYIITPERRELLCAYGVIFESIISQGQFDRTLGEYHSSGLLVPDAQLR